MSQEQVPSPAQSLEPSRRGKRGRLRLAIAIFSIAAACAVAAFVASLTSPRQTGCDPRKFCIEVLGPKGDSVDPLAPIQVKISGKVDRDAIVAALKIDGAPAGKVRFEGDVLTFRPAWPGLVQGMTYGVVLDLSKAALPAGVAPVDLSFSFTTSGKLAVASVFPGSGSSEVSLDAELIVQFNRAVAPLGILAETGPANIIAFTPPIEGTGRWLSTSLYTFKPAAGWSPSTYHSGVVKAGLSNQLGDQLVGDYAFNFTTLSAAVASVAPPEGSKFVAPDQVVSVAFNQPVDLMSALELFTLRTADGTRIEGEFAWTSDRSFDFHPSQPLPLATTFTASQSAGVLLPNGNRTSFTRSWTFSTVEAPKIILTSPAPGATNVIDTQVKVVFSNPMDQKAVEDALHFDPPLPGTLFPSWDQGGVNLYLYTTLKPSTDYHLSISRDALDRYGQHLLEPLDLTFKTAPLKPGISIWRRGQTGTFNAYLDPTIYANAWNVPALTYHLYRSTAADLIAFETSPSHKAPSGDPIREWTEVVTADQNETVSVSSRLAAPGEHLPEGFYWLTVTAKGAETQSLPFVVSSVNVTTKKTDRDILVWLVDEATGAPLAGISVDVVNGGTAVGSRTSAADGTALIPYAAARNYSTYISGSGGGRVIFSGIDWSNGYYVSSFASNTGAYSYVGTSSLVGYLYTDRPIYRPGETVHIKGVVRKDDDALYSVPDGATLDFVVRDYKQQQIEKRQVTLSDFGTFDVDFVLNGDAATGQYYVSISDPMTSTGQYDQVTSVAFRVAEFRKPEFEVDVATDRPSYVDGEKATATLDADLFFGAPVRDAAVHWRVTASQYTFRSDDYKGFVFSDSATRFDNRSSPFARQQQLFRSEGDARTDSSGQASFSFTPDISADPLSETFTVEATVTDGNEQQVAGNKAVIVHKGAFYAGLKLRTLIAREGQESAVDVVTITPDSKAVPNKTLVAKIYSRTWRTVRQRDADGTLNFKSEPDDTLLETRDVLTDGEGKASFSFTPPGGGQFLVAIEGHDNGGHLVKSATFLWVASGRYATWQIGNDDLIQLVADKDEYRPGETAHVLVAAPFDASMALVTQERGHILAHSTGYLATNSEVLNIPITADSIPNLYLSVALYKAPTAENPLPQVKFGTVELKVATEEKRLNIAITPDRTKYGPSETVVYDIRTTDSAGRGVPAEISVAVVDKAVLSLQDDFARQAHDAFWFRRFLGVQTASSFAHSVDRANELALKVAGGGKGGGGGHGDQTRTYFPNTAYWNAALHTGEDGRATVSFNLPDTLTTWTLTARGLTKDSKAGQVTNEIVTSQDVIVRPILPRFLNAGDDLRLGAIVHNFTGSKRSFDVSIEAAGLSMTAPAMQTVDIAAGDEAVVFWPVTVPAGLDASQVTLRATTGTASDQVAVMLPAYAYFTGETVATAGEVKGQEAEALFLPDYVSPTKGDLTVTVSPSIASGTNTAFRYLQEFPWESAELTTSRFLAALALNHAATELNLTDLTNRGDAPDLARRSLARLYANQHSDGGWGWWQSDDSDPAVTAYVLLGLAEAKATRIAVDVNSDANAARYLRTRLDASRDILYQAYDLRAFMLYALARDGHGDLGRSYALAEQVTSLGNTAKAWVAMAIKLSGGSDTDPRLTTLLTSVMSTAVLSATGSHWEEKKYEPAVFGSSIQTTTQVLEALTLLQPDSPLLDSTVRWLMVARKEGRWESTHASAVSLLAITDFMLLRKDVQSSFDYDVALNGDVKLKGEAVAGKMDQENRLVIPIVGLVRDAVNELRFEVDGAEGDGRLYYSADLHYYTPAANVASLNRGIGVSRQYFAGDGDAATPTKSVQVGDLVRVEITLTAAADLNFVTVEDFLPAGLEPLDTSLKVTPLEIRQRLAADQQKAFSVSKKYSPFSHTDIRDNKIGLFARFIGRGVYQYTYYARATIAGSFQSPPIVAQEQYMPEIFGRGDGGTFTVTQ